MNWVAIVEVMAEEDYMTRPVAVTLFWEKVAVCGNSTLNSTLMTWRIWLKIIFVQIITQTVRQLVTENICFFKVLREGYGEYLY